MSRSAISFSDLQGWMEDDHRAALACFKMSARGFVENASVTRVGKPPSKALLKIAEKSLAKDFENPTSDAARVFFEEHFVPTVLTPKESGFVTAYFEPVVPASRIKSSQFSYPIYRRPSDLIRLNENDEYPKGLPKNLQYARKTPNGLEEYYDRQAIDEGALSDQGLELFWVKSSIEAFFIHVQGSARLELDDGEAARISFAGKSGHVYSSIGKHLVDKGVFTPETANMQNLRKWLEDDLERANEVLHQNRSYIFFTEVEGHHPEFGPIAAAGVQLTPGRSLAVDKLIHPYGTPVWINTDEPLPSYVNRFQRLMIAQDTGSAIVGPQRGDIFIGSGDEAGMIAGGVRHTTQFVVFEPKSS